MESNEDEQIQLRKKCDSLEKNLRCLMSLGYRAADDYDKLYKMYDENQKQYEKLKLRCQDTEAKLMKLQKTLLPACEEYNQLNRHLQIEAACRTKLETIAAEVTRENKKLKHQSQAIIEKLGEAKVDMKFLETITDEPELNENSSSCSAAEQNALNDKITSLEDDVRVLQKKLQTAQEEKEFVVKNEAAQTLKVKKLESELLKACKKIEDHNQMVENFKRSSTLALTEYSNLQDAYSKQMLLNQKAEEYAHEMLVQRDTVFRQSSIVLSSAMSDERVHQALNEIERLTKELETVKREHHEKVKSLEQEIASSGDVQKTSSLETELEIASSEVSRLHRAVQELEEWKQMTIVEMNELREKLNEAEDRLRPPPPPPPPPPPECPPPFLGPKLLIVKSNKSMTPATPTQGPASLVKSKEVHLADAMSEMMARIKSGNVLAKSGTVKAVAPKPEAPKAILELEGILKSLNVKRSEDNIDAAVTSRRPSAKSSVPPPVMSKPLKPASIRKPAEPAATPSLSELERHMSRMQSKTAQRHDSEKTSDKNSGSTSPIFEETSTDIRL